MKNFHVTYYYLATGMEGNPDVQDYGIVSANSELEARQKVASRELPSAREWMMSCLEAKEI